MHWVQRVVERNIEILGEVGRRVLVKFQRANLELDWHNIIALRSVISHRYKQVDHELLWEIVQNILPNLVVILESFLPAFPGFTKT